MQKRKNRALLAALFALCALLAAGVAYGDQSVTISDAWVRATAPGQTVAGAFLEITSPTRASIIGVESEAAKSAEIHLSGMENGVMKMREIKKIDVPAGKTLRFAPGGYHIMLIDVKHALAPGEKVPLSLKLERADKSLVEVTINATVRAIGDRPPAKK